MGASAGGVRAGRAFVEIGIKDSFTNGLKAAEKRLKAFGKGISVIGASMAGIGAAGVGAIAGITSVFGDFDAQMASVRAKTNANAEDMAKLRDMAKELGATTKFSASEAAKGMDYLAMAGFNTKQIMAGLPATLNLAAAGGLELGEAADIASDVSSAFGLTADEIGRVADVIATTATSANTDVRMMGETFKFVAPLAKAAGQSIEEVSAAAGILGNSGIKATMAGTDLKNILSRLSLPKVQKGLAAIGVSATDSSGELRPMMDVLRDFDTKTKNMTGPEKLALANKLFGAISAKSAVILASAGDQIDLMRSKMDASSGSAERMAGIMQDSVDGAIVSFKSALESVVIELGEALAPTLRTVIDTGTSLLRSISEFVKNNKILVISFFGVTLAIGAAGVALATVGGLIALTGAVIGGFVTMISAAATVIATVGWPIILLVAAVGLLGAALAGGVVYFFAFTESGRSMVAVLMERFSALWNFVKPVLGAITEALKRGDWAAAAAIAWAGLKTVFWRGAAEIDNVIARLTISMVMLFTKGLAKLAVATGKFTSQFSKAMIKLASGDFLSASAVFSSDNIKKMFSGLTTPGTLSAFDAYAKDQAKKSQAELNALMAQFSVGGSTDANIQNPPEPKANDKAPDVPKPDRPDLKKLMSEAYKEIDAKKTAEEKALKNSLDGLGALNGIPSGKNLAGSDAFGVGSGTGTFSSYAAALITSAGPMDRVAKATEKSKESLERIDKNIENAKKVEQLQFVA